MSKLQTKLYPFQNAGVRAIDRFAGRCLVSWEMGLGKTILSLTWGCWRKKFPIIVVCPKGLKWNWEREALLHLRLRSEILGTTKAPKFSRSLIPAPLTIINYDVLHHWVDYLKQLKPQLVIGDEIHYCKERSTKRTKAFIKLCSGVPHVLALSGTPLLNRPVELFPILNILAPDTFPAFFSYGREFCNGTRGRFGWDFRGASNLRKLHRILTTTCMIRKRKKDVLTDLPAKARHVVLLDVDDRQQYNRALTDFVGWAKDNLGKAKAKRITKAERLVKVGYLKRLAATLKLRAAIEWIDNYLANSNDKITLFCIHKSIVSTLYKHYGRNCVKVDGSVHGRERQNAVDRFNEDKSCRVFIGNIQAAGQGWNAKDCATIAFLEFGWTPGEHAQAEARAHGIGRGIAGRQTMIYYLAAYDTIEEKLCHLLNDKQNVFDNTLDGQENASDFDLLTQLIKELTKKNDLSPAL